jgi:HK97 family phage prohead protease
MKPVYQYKSFQHEVKADSVKEGIISGYFSSFNVEDSYGDTVLPGAFKKTISEQGPNSVQPRIKYLLNHDVSLPIGKILSLEEDSYGLKYSAQIGTNAAAVDFMKMVESGLITEHSIGYRTMKAIDKEDYRKRDLLELKLFEGSALSGWGVNQFTPLTGVKSEDQLAQTQKRIDRLEKFCRNSDATDDTIDMLLLEVKQLTQLTIDLKTTKPTENVTKPVAKAINWEYIATSLLKN